MKTLRSTIVSSFTLTAIMVAINSAAQAADLYTMTDLGSLGGTTYVEALNNSGQVVGYSCTTTDPNCNAHAFLYSNGTMTDLGTFGGATSVAYTINNGGQVGGYGWVTGSTNEHAFIYSNGTMTDINASVGGSQSWVKGINDNGQAVGLNVTTNHGYLYNGGVATDLGGFAPNKINTNGVIVGRSQDAHASVYNNGTITDLSALFGPGFDKGQFSEAMDINNSGQIVGWGTYLGYNSNHAFLYSNGVMTDLGTLGPTGLYGSDQSAAYGINNNGQVVGSTNSGAFLYSNGTMVDLNGLIQGGTNGVWLASAWDINDSGQIIVQGNNGHSYLLSSVPVPGAVWLMGSALAGLATYKKRRQPK